MKGFDIFSGGIDAGVWIISNGLVVLFVVAIVRTIKRVSVRSKLTEDESEELNSQSLDERLGKAGPPVKRLDRKEIPSGWYADPAEFGAERFFSSETGWTDRIKGHLSDSEYEEPRFPVVVNGIEVEFLDTLPDPVVEVPSLYFDWYPDPLQMFEMRYWDGSRWTKSVMIDGQVLNQDELVSEEVRASESTVLERTDVERINANEGIGSSKLVEDLSELSKLFERGLLNEKEFAIAKQRLLQN
jgi:hypothetical protein